MWGASNQFFNAFFLSFETLWTHWSFVNTYYFLTNPLLEIRHYLVIPIWHIPTVKNLHRRSEDYSLGKKNIALLLVWDSCLFSRNPCFKSLISHSSTCSQWHVTCWSNSITKRCTSCQALQVWFFSAHHWLFIFLAKYKGSGFTMFLDLGF